MAEGEREEEEEEEEEEGEAGEEGGRGSGGPVVVVGGGRGGRRRSVMYPGKPHCHLPVFYAPPHFHIHSTWTPHTPHGLHMDSRSLQTPHGVHLDVCGTPCGVQELWDAMAVTPD